MGFDSPFGSWMPHVLSVRFYLSDIPSPVDYGSVPTKDVCVGSIPTEGTSFIQRLS